MRIVFMGTPEFAIPSLDILRKAGYDIVGVVTAPDRPSGRGQKLRPSAIKSYAVEHQIPVLQPVKLRDPEFLSALKALQPDLAVVVAFRMLPKLVWRIPGIGTLNLHAALLPDYRGAAPINWVLINGESQTGVSTFMIDEKIDTGGILLQQTVEIPDNWTAGDLHDCLMQEGARLVLKTVEGLETQTIQPVAQDHSQFFHPAPKIYKEDCKINWNRPAGELYHFIRGLSPYPTAWTHLNGNMFKLFRASRLLDRVGDASPGQISITNSPVQFRVACKDYWLSIEEVQLAGKKRMTTVDFLRGYKGILERLES
ncbi:MAG: methionyl-tRNA formyltransferase [Bacteroidota bacterium]